MHNLKTLTNEDIDISTKGIVYLCSIDYKNKELDIFRCIQYESPFIALNAYANIPNPASQLITGKTFDELILAHNKFREDVKDPQWIEELINSI